MDFKLAAVLLLSWISLGITFVLPDDSWLILPLCVVTVASGTATLIIMCVRHDMKRITGDKVQ